jgi:ABC-type transport system substrate-binding protein/class 3 adenylate cyclase/streptogramin lyase
MPHNPRVADTELPVDPPGNDRRSDAQIRTFLIADVRGYTLFTQERGDETAAKLAAKFADIAREVIEGRGGTLLELRGDEALCVFSSAREAIRAALDLQQRFVDETLEQPELPLTVGIGLDAGEAVAVQGGYRGGALNLAARLCGQAGAGEILASREVTHLARRLEGVRYEDRGPLTLKGMSDPVSVVRVVPEGEDPAVRLRPFAPSQPAPARISRRWAPVGAIVLVLAIVAISIPLLTSGGGAGVDIGANSVARMDPTDGTVELAEELGQRPGASAVGFGSLWVAQPDRGVVTRLDLDDGSVSDTIPVGNAPAGLAVDEESVWVTNAVDGTVDRITESGEVTQTIPAGSAPNGIAVGDGFLWIADSNGAALLRVDPSSGEAETVPLAGLPSGVVFTSEGVWVSIAPDSVARIDPAGPDVVLTQRVGNGPTAVAAAFGSIWVANHLDGTVTRLEPSTGDIEASIEVGRGPNALVPAAGSLWVANEFDDAVVSIDPGTNDVSEPVPVGGAAASLAGDDQGLWVAVGASATQHRGGTLRLSSSLKTPKSLDPAVAYDTDAWRILTITNDGLLAYRKVGGPDGAMLVPDLASALPDVSADGLTYRFPLREGIRYSNGEPVRPEDFRRGIERSLGLHGAGPLLSAIEGAGACIPVDPEAPTPDCDLQDSIVVDEEAVTFHLATPDPELPLKLAMPFAFPVPADTPTEDQGMEPVPATGPYMIAEAGTKFIELARNPEFREWSAAAQPDGFVDTISLRFGEKNLAESFDALEGGDVDVMLETPTPEDLATLRSEHPDRIVYWPGAFTLYVGFDVQKPPFDDERVRQALNYAIDRQRVVDILGGPTTQRLTCQILPPNLPGYAPFCPYTADPDVGAWSAPDMERAQALIEEAGAAGQVISVSAAEVQPGAIKVMRYIVEVLEDLGLKPDFGVSGLGAYFDGINPPTPDGSGTPAGSPKHPHVYISGWLSDYLGAGNFIEPQFACGPAGFANTSGWCDDALEGEIDEALLLTTTDRGASNRAWAEIDRRLVEASAQAPVTNPVFTHAVADRVENVQVHPQWGLMLSLVWVQ